MLKKIKSYFKAGLDNSLKIKVRQNLPLIFSLILLIPIFIILYKIYIPRVNEFGCFDDCNNFMRGYFVLQGKSLFTEVFSGHQPFGSYLSTIIQYLTNPENIYELVLRHRQFIFLFSFIFNILIILRFGAKFIIFTILFEFSSFYLFGDRFLGDSMIVYTIIYVFGLFFTKYKNKKIYTFDYIFAAILTWFTIFMREAYGPVALFTLFIFLWSWPIKKISIVSFVLFSFLSLITVFVHDVKEYFFNVVTFNFLINLPAEVKSEMFGPKILHWFFYPIYIYFYGQINIFKILLIGINSVFIILFLNLIWNKKFLIALIIFITLGLLNVRVVMPGLVFYSAFHMLAWYGLLIFITIELLFLAKKNKPIFITGLLILFISFSIFISSKDYFGTQKIDTHASFITNYGNYLQQGEVLRVLSDSNDTLFLDGSHDLLYWQSKLNSTYKYSWYTSSMPYFEKYTDERIKMFKTNPPDFYREHGSCFKPKNYVASKNHALPDFVKNDYVRLYTDRPSCLYVHKKKIPEITKEQLKRAAEFGYHFKEL